MHLVFRTLLFISMTGLIMNTDELLANDKVKVGDAAPDFELKASDGKTYKLSDFKGKNDVVVAWFPKAFTTGCTVECKSMKETSKDLKELKNLKYFTASCDDVETNTRFAKSLDVDYPILSDPDGATAKAYGIYNEGRNFPNRVTFYIDKQGIIKHIDSKVNVKSHGPDIVAKAKELKFD